MLGLAHARFRRVLAWAGLLALLTLMLLGEGVRQAHAATLTVYPSANAAVTSGRGDNNGYGTNPTNAYSATDSSAVAVDTNSGSANNNGCTSTGADAHRWSGFNVTSLPSCTGCLTVTGLTVEQVVYVSATANGQGVCSSLSWDTGTSWTTHTGPTSISQTTCCQTVQQAIGTGHAVELWTYAELAAMQVETVNQDTNNSASGYDYSLDAVRVVIGYTVNATPTPTPTATLTGGPTPTLTPTPTPTPTVTVTSTPSGGTQFWMIDDE